MEFEFWWLLAIPLFFGLGWLAARADARQSRQAAERLPDAYFRGLNFLLAEQPDQAIDAFVDVVKLDPETIELHFLLGNLFRRRGETDRAIRVHQSLIDRRDLDPQRRARAMYELGRDFLKAGLLDRAEAAFVALEQGPHAADALRHRLEIAQLVRDWPLAIELADRLGEAGGPPDTRRRTAHFHCELAERALVEARGGAAGDVAAPATAPVAASTAEAAAMRAQREIDAALAIEPDHPRPWLLRGEAAWARRDAAAAIGALERLSRVAPAHLSLAAPTWLAAHESIGRAQQGIERLEAVAEQVPSVDLAAAVADAIARRDGPQAAAGWAEAQLRERPSLLGLERLVGLQLSAPALPTARRVELELVRDLIRGQAQRVSRFTCNHCGFKARRYHWQCPGCNRWDTYAPLRGEEMDAPA
jgi:lipopolysaccharide biosynthesis regulator YciM